MPILNQKTIDFVSHGYEQTERIGIRLGELLKLGDVLCLSGELGAGKTVLARGIGWGWGSSNRVTSPTFTLINAYPRTIDGRILYHMDGYRLSSDMDVISSGIEDIFLAENTIMIEWPERLTHFLPSDHLWITLSPMGLKKRRIVIEAFGDRPYALLQEFKQNAFGINR